MAIKVPRKLALKESTFRYIILGSLGLTALLNGVGWIMSIKNGPKDKDF